MAECLEAESNSWQRYLCFNACTVYAIYIRRLSFLRLQAIVLHFIKGRKLLFLMSGRIKNCLIRVEHILVGAYPNKMAIMCNWKGLIIISKEALQRLYANQTHGSSITFTFF